MGSVVSSLIGAGGGAGGTGFAPATSSTLTVNPTNQQQIDSSYAGTQNSLAQQNALLSALQGQQGLQNQSNVYNQLQGVANGTGPNPAQAQLAQATGANVANQNALMAGQRGSNANAGLLARQAAMQGANTQQNAANQAATLQANQSLGALNQLGGIAGNQVSNQIGATGANTQANQGLQQALLNAQAGYNTNATSTQNSINAANAGLAQGAQQGQQAMIGGLFNAAGAASGLTKGATALMADGGMATAPLPTQGPQSKFGQFLAGMGSTAPQAMMAEGGKVPALVSPGEKYLSPEKVEAVAKGADPMEEGKTVPGKPKVGGNKNSYANDTVKATLDEGGIVLPRSVTQSKHPHWAAHKFVSEIMAKKNGLKQGLK